MKSELGSLSPSKIGRRLAVSYVLVTTGTVLALEAILLAGVLGFMVWFFTSSRLLPDLLAREAGRTAVQLEPFFASTPPDTEGLKHWLLTREKDGLNAGGFSIEWQRAPAALKGKDEGQKISPVWTIVDRNGYVVASSWSEKFPRGAQFRDDDIEEARALVMRALRGEDPSPPGIRDKLTRLAAAACPIRAKDRSVAGAVYLRIAGQLDAPIPIWRTIADFLRPIGISALVLLILTTPVGLLFGSLTARPFARYLRMLVERNTQLAAESEELAAMRERNRLARELHDSVNQELFAIAMRAAAIRELEKRDPDLARRYVAELEEMVRRVQREMRSLILQLRPPALKEGGLAPALMDYVKTFAEREGLGVEWKVGGHEERLPPALEDALFRIAQEALANVARHADANHVKVELEYRPDGVALSVTDDGKGFDPASPDGKAGFGLVSMQERAELAGGKLVIRSEPGKGTCVEAVLPRKEGTNVGERTHPDTDSR